MWPGSRWERSGSTWKRKRKEGLERGQSLWKKLSPPGGTEMKILMIRHGKTRGNLEGRYVGRTDEPLLPEEEERLRGMEYSLFCPDAVYTSGLLRCRQTAEILFGQEKGYWKENAGWTEPGRRAYTNTTERYVICPGLNEMDFGIFEYKNYQELNGTPEYQKWIDSGGLSDIPDGEPGAGFRERCRIAFLDCLENAKERKARRAAFVVHGGTIMAVMEAFGRPRRDFYGWQIKNGEGILTELREAHGGVSLELCREIQ